MIVGKSEEINKKTIAEVESVTQPSAASKVIPLKKCTRCGAELTEEQIFCPHCGQKNDLHIAEDVSDAIAQFNQGIVKQAKKEEEKNQTTDCSVDYRWNYCGWSSWSLYFL